MKISKDSWHFKAARFAYSWIDWQSNIGLCNYFWMVVFGIFKIMFTGVWIAVLAVAGVLGLLYPIIQIWTGVTPVLSLCLVAYLILFMTLWSSRENLPAPLQKEIILFDRRDKKEMTPNLLTEYIKAKKQKICPILEIQQ